MSDEQTALFDPTPYQFAPAVGFQVQDQEVLSPTRRRTQKVDVMIANGQHPMGGATHPLVGTCGNCAQLRRVEYHNSHYLKCALVRWTHGGGTDIRRKWPACPRWESLSPPAPIVMTPPQPGLLTPTLAAYSGPDNAPTLGGTP